MGDGLSAAAVYLFTLSLLISPFRNFFGGEWIKALAVVEFWNWYHGVGFWMDGEPAVAGSVLTLYFAWRWWLDFCFEKKKKFGVGLCDGLH